MNTILIRRAEEIPELFSNARAKDPIAYAKFHASWIKTSWYMFEWDGKDTFFGYQVREGEPRSYGLFRLSQLAQHKSPWGAGVIQDYSFQPTPMSELRRLEKEKSKGVSR